MFFSDLEALTRKFIADDADVYGIDDRDLLVGSGILGQYITAGERQFCRDTGYIRDRTGVPTQIALAQGDQTVTLDSSILQIYTARLDGVPLKNNRRLLDTLDESAPEAQPSEYAVDLASRDMYFNTPADAAYTIKLTAWRLPLAAFTGLSKKQQPEIPEQFHIALAHYAAFMVFTASDEELLDNTGASKQNAMFQGYVVEGKRMMSLIVDTGAQPEVAVGSNGWSW